MKRSIQLSVLLLVTALLLIQCNVLWLPPKKYHPVNRVTLAPPVMTLEEYTSSGLISRHPRPYVYTIESRNTRGAVLVFGAEHTFDPNHKQFPAMKENWDRFNPTTALVEGNLDLILTWFFNPVKASGEGGYTQELAKSKGIKIYSWEPGIEAEMDAILEKHDPFHVAVFYCLRPYQNRWDQFSKAGQDSKMAHLIADRAQYKTLRGTLTSVDQVDSLWKADFPSLPSWRSYKHPENGWPDGMLKQIAEETNMVRDVNMCRAIIELVNKGERVFISMGASHAPRIEGTLRGMIQ
ncbi:MAG: hypothetical protein J0L54_15995 [Chitinophagales bacterium]|nr:hypothetical protein [Chitinophagales bacterium]